MTRLWALEHLLIVVHNLLFQFEVGHDPLVLSVEVFGGCVHVGADGDDRSAVFDLGCPPVGLHGGDEVAHVACGLV